MAFGMEAGDLPGWIGAITGLGALAWNGIRAWRASRIQNEARISASMKPWGRKALISVTFEGAETHTSYILTVACRTPRKLHGAQLISYGSVATEEGTTQIQPFNFTMQRLVEEQDRTRARFTVHGFGSRRPLYLTFTVRERSSRRVVAKRRLPMSIT